MKILTIETPKPSSAVTIGDNVVNHYTRNDYGMPADNIPVANKDIDWCRKFANASLCLYFQGGTVMPWGGRDRMLDLRAYLHGKQDPARYYPQLFGPNIAKDINKVNMRKGFYRADFSRTPSLMPQAADYLKGKIDEVDYHVDSYSLNPLAGDEKDKRKYRLLTQGSLPKEYLANLASVGVGVNHESMISNEAEYQLMESIGANKTAEELCVEMLTNHSFKLSEWPLTSDMLQEDIIAFNKAAAKDELDRYSGKVYCRYVDPVNSVFIQSSNHSTKRLVHAGELRLMTIKDIRLEAEANGIPISESVLQGCAEFYQSQYFNRFSGNATSMCMLPGTAMYSYDNFFVLVYDCEHLTIDSETKVLRKNAEGAYYYHRVDPTDERYREGGDNVVKKSREYFYRCKMVVGTGFVFDYGRCTDQKRYMPSRAESSFHLTMRPGPSMVERCIDVLDDIAIDGYQYQNARARAVPSGIAVGKSALQGMKDNGNDVNELDMMDLYSLDGKILYNDITIVGHSIMQNGVPIKELPGGMGKALEEHITKYNFNLARLKKVMNTEPIEQKPRVGLGVNELVEQQNDRSVRGLVEMYKELKESLANGMYKRVKIAITHNKDIYNGYYPIIGRTALEVMKITADLNLSDMGICLIARSTNQEAQQDLTRIEEQMRGGRDGEAVLDASMYFIIRNAVMTGRRHAAEAFIILAERKKKEWKQMIAERNQEIQARIGQELEASKLQGAIAVIWEKAKAEDWVNANEHERKMEELRLTNQNSLILPQQPVPIPLQQVA